MKIVIIGTGNVATVLAKKMIAAQHKIVQVIGRSESNTKILADVLQCPYSLDLQELEQKSDGYFICVQDKEINNVVAKMNVPDEAIVVHTAGGVSIKVLAEKFKHYGVVYPLQSLRKEAVVLPLIPFFIDANNYDNSVLLTDFAKTMSSQVHQADDVQRMQLHVVAVFVSNFTNYLYTLADDYCAATQIDFSFLQSLIEETTNRMRQFAPDKVQTGPAVRGDSLTLQKHIEMLTGFEEAQEVYRFLSEKIQTHFKN